jgi:PKD repeat protein
MIVNFANIRRDKSWRFLFVTISILFLNAQHLAAQNVVPNFLVDKTIQCFSSNRFELTNITQGNNITYKWDFGDGSFDTARDAVKTYNSIGNFNITLIATRNNISYYFSKQIVVAADPVISSISLQGTFSGSSYTYISSSTIAAGNMSYLWDFGDSVSSTLVNPTHIYTNSGTYNVLLKVQSDYGCTTIKNYTVNVSLNDTALVGSKFTINKTNQCISGNNFVFTNQSNLTEASSYYWDFGDGTSSYSVDASKTYTNIGTYTVRLNIVKAGVTSICEKRITVGSNVTANFDTIAFQNNSKFIFANTTSPLNSTIKCYWNFGDGCSSQETNPQHQFFSGNYNVNLLVVDTLGCDANVSKNIVINTSAPSNIISSFKANKDTQCFNNNSFYFTNQSTKQCNVSYEWSFGDGTSSTLFEPQKQYNKTGVFDVALKVIAGNNLFVSTKKVVVKNEAIWIGAFSNNWSDTANWLCSYPTDTSDIIVRKSASFPLTINNDNIKIRNLFVDSGAILKITNSSLTLNGNMFAFGSMNAQSSTLTFAGSNRQILRGNLKVGKLIINNIAGVEIGNNATDSVSVYDLVTLKLGTFYTNEKLIFKSNATNTARLDKVGVVGNSGSLVGSVIIERYFFNKRAWRFYTSPITANGNNTNFNINNTWQKLTNITGPSGVGLDYVTPFYSLKSWNNITQTWGFVTNTYTSYIVNNDLNFSNIPYCLYVRGDKTITDTYSSGETVFSLKGNLQTGNQIKNFSGNRKGNFILVGNPYASPVDLANITSQGISGNFYFYDPTLGESGAYVTVSNKGNGNWIITPSTPGQKDRIMQSGHAVFVEVAQPNGSIMFTENSKVDASTNNLFGTTNNTLDRLQINLYRINTDSSKTLLDGAVTIFGNNYRKSVDEKDSRKMINSQENIGFINESSILAIDARPYVQGEDSINIYTSGLIDSLNYAIELKVISDDSSIQKITLFDSVLNTNKTSISGNASWYYFKSTNSVANTNQRFSLFVANNTKQTKLVNLNAKQIDEKVSINFDVENEKNVKDYQIQYSIDNQVFETFATTQATNNSAINSYSIIDATKRKLGTNFYRIISVFNNDATVISQSVSVQFKEAKTNSIEVYPNPTTAKFTVSFNSKSNQTILLKIAESSTGKIVKTIFINAKIGSNKMQINLEENDKLNNGLYILNLEGDDNIFEPQKITLLRKQ